MEKMDLGTLIPLAGLAINLLVIVCGALWAVMKITNVTTRLEAMIEHLDKTICATAIEMGHLDHRISEMERWQSMMEEWRKNHTHHKESQN